MTTSAQMCWKGDYFKICFYSLLDFQQYIMQILATRSCAISHNSGNFIPATNTQPFASKL